MKSSLDGDVRGNLRVLLRINSKAESGRTMNGRQALIKPTQSSNVSGATMGQKPVSRFAHNKSQRITATSGA